VGGNGGQQPHKDDDPAVMQFTLFHVSLLSSAIGPWQNVCIVFPDMKSKEI
jgi:hypothetical protein